MVSTLRDNYQPVERSSIPGQYGNWAAAVDNSLIFASVMKYPHCCFDYIFIFFYFYFDYITLILLMHDWLACRIFTPKIRYIR